MKLYFTLGQPKDALHLDCNTVIVELRTISSRILYLYASLPIEISASRLIDVGLHLEMCGESFCDESICVLCA